MLAALASFDDIQDRTENAIVTTLFDYTVQALLDSASAVVRDAAGCAISLQTSTVTLVVNDPWEIDLPAGPVASVASVAVGGVAVTGWRKVGDTLLMPRTRWVECLPAEVVVTYSHGYPQVPADIVDLVCSLVAMAAADIADGYGSSGRLASIKLAEFAETYIHPAGTESPSPVAIPDSVRQRLRARFGNSVAVIGMR